MKKPPDAIPGGAGRNAAWRRGGRKPSAIPGGGKWPAAKIGPDGKFPRGDLHMRNKAKTYDEKDGWHKAGLTFASGTPRRDPVSLKILGVIPTGKKPRAIGDKEWNDAMLAAGEFDSRRNQAQSGTSIFDPVLCELLYRWFCPPGGLVLDPFAGGSVRGLVAARLGRRYVGIDLSQRQIEANRAQVATVCRPGDPVPEWVVGNAEDIGTLDLSNFVFDFLIACPPYHDLEVYSDDPRDLSTMPYDAFLQAYERIIAAAVARLRPDRFAAFVVGDVRDKAGFYRAFPQATVEAFRKAGAGLYNEAVLITAVGSLPVRVRKQFETGRKLGKTHQNVLVFCKGNPKRAAAAVGPVEFGALEEAPLEAGPQHHVFEDPYTDVPAMPEGVSLPGVAPLEMPDGGDQPHGEPDPEAPGTDAGEAQDRDTGPDRAPISDTEGPGRDE